MLKRAGTHDLSLQNLITRKITKCTSIYYRATTAMCMDCGLAMVTGHAAGHGCGRWVAASGSSNTALCPRRCKPGPCSSAKLLCQASVQALPDIAVQTASIRRNNPQPLPAPHRTKAVTHRIRFESARSLAPHGSHSSGRHASATDTAR